MSTESDAVESGGTSPDTFDALILQENNLPTMNLLTVVDLGRGGLKLGVAATDGAHPELDGWSVAVRDAVLTQLMGVGKPTIRKAKMVRSPERDPGDSISTWADAVVDAGVDYLIVVRLAAVEEEPGTVEVTLELVDDEGSVLKTLQATDVLVMPAKADAPAITPEMKAFHARAWTLGAREHRVQVIRNGVPAGQRTTYEVELVDEHGEVLSMLEAANRLDDWDLRSRAMVYALVPPALFMGQLLAIAGIPVVLVLSVAVGGAIALPLYLTLRDQGHPNPATVIAIPAGCAVVVLPPAVAAAFVYGVAVYYGRFAIDRWLMAAVVREHNTRVAAQLGIDLQGLPEQYRPDGWDSGGQ